MDMKTDSRLRVLLVADHTDHDGALHGAGRQFLALVTALEAHEQVDVLALVVRPPSELGRRLMAEGSSVRYMAYNPYDPRIAWELARRCRKHSIDLLHVTDFAASTWGRIAGLITRTPVLVHVRSHHSPQQPRGFPLHAAAAYRLLAPVTTRAIAISESVRTFAIQRMGFAPDQVEVLPNPLAEGSFGAAGVDSMGSVRQRHGIPASAKVVGAVTRFHSVKGIHHLIEAFATVLDQVPAAYLLLVGEGPDKSRLMALANSLGIQERVVFAGYREDVRSYYEAFDVSAIPSLEEGFGNVAVEAMATGIPVVASDLGGLGEIITDGETGLLVPAADPPALAGALLRILRDARFADHLAQGGRRRADDYSFDSYLARLIEIYRRTSRSH